MGNYCELLWKPSRLAIFYINILYIQESHEEQILSPFFASYVCSTVAYPGTLLTKTKSIPRMLSTTLIRKHCFEHGIQCSNNTSITQIIIMQSHDHLPNKGAMMIIGFHFYFSFLLDFHCPIHPVSHFRCLNFLFPCLFHGKPSRHHYHHQNQSFHVHSQSYLLEIPSCFGHFTNWFIHSIPFVRI